MLTVLTRVIHLSVNQIIVRGRNAAIHGLVNQRKVIVMIP
jgi:hypothetical protein